MQLGQHFFYDARPTFHPPRNSVVEGRGYNGSVYMFSQKLE